MVVAAGAQGVRKVVSGVDLPGVLVAYNDAVTTVFVSVTWGGGRMKGVR